MRTPAVRVAAVYELGPDEGDALRALAREDAERACRRAAVTRIDDAAVLAEIARTDPDEDVRAEAVRGLAGLAAEADDVRPRSRRSRQLLGLGRTKEVVLVARDSSSADVRGADRRSARRCRRRLARSAGMPRTARRACARWHVSPMATSFSTSRSSRSTPTPRSLRSSAIDRSRGADGHLAARAQQGGRTARARKASRHRGAARAVPARSPR